jgi:hypothetical protein
MLEVNKYILAGIDFSQETENQSIWTAINDAQGFVDYNDNDPDEALFTNEEAFNVIVEEPFIDNWRNVWAISTFDQELSPLQVQFLETECDFQHHDANYRFYCFICESDAWKAAQSLGGNVNTGYLAQISK